MQAILTLPICLVLLVALALASCGRIVIEPPSFAADDYAGYRQHHVGNGR